MTIVISGFPGVGKSEFFNTHEDCMDSDSSTFDKSGFPKNYIEHIKTIVKENKVKYLFVSSHESVRIEMFMNGIYYNLVYPDVNLKDEYLERYKQRGSSKEFVDLMDKMWDTFIESCYKDFNSNSLRIGSGQYLSDVIRYCKEAPPTDGPYDYGRGKHMLRTKSGFEVFSK